MRQAPLHRRALLAIGGAAGAVLLSPVSRAGAGAAAEAPFAADIRLPGLLHAVVARPPLPGWRLSGLDAGAALALRGVVAVTVLEPCAAEFSERGGVAVLARDTWTALRGRDALLPVWEPGPAPVELAAARGAAFFVPETAEPLMEPPCAVVAAGAACCTAWACLREPERVRAALAALLGLPAGAVALHASAPAAGPERVSNPALVLEAARLSRAVGTPVCLVWTRADDIPFRVPRRAPPPVPGA